MALVFQQNNDILTKQEKLTSNALREYETRGKIKK